MSKFYNIENNTKREISECNPFEVEQEQNTNIEKTSTYDEVLRIFREALSYVDIMKIIKKL